MNLSETLAMNLPFPKNGRISLQLHLAHGLQVSGRHGARREAIFHLGWEIPQGFLLGKTSDRNGCYPSNPVVFHKTMGILKLFEQNFQWKMDEHCPLSCQFRCCLGVFLVFLCFLRFGNVATCICFL